MSTATSPAPSTPFPPRQFKQVDPEPDKAWKDNLYKTIEETLQSMVDDAKKAYEERLAAAGSEAARGLAEEEYHKNMNNIRNLAKESFQAELNRERQERMATIKEAQAILETKRRDSVNQKAWHESRKQAAAAVVVEKPQPPVVGAYSHESSSFPPRNGPSSIPATIPIAPTRPNDEHSDSHSPRGLDIRNFDYPRPAPPRSQPEPSPPKRRSASSEVHSIPSPALPSSVTKSPMPPSSPFTSGAPFRPQDPSPTLGIAPINVVARDLPPELAARRDQYSSLSRRGSNAASQAREGYPRPSIPSFSSPKVDKPPQPPPSTDDHVTTDPEDESTSPMSSRWNPRRTSGSQDRGVDLPSSRSVERPAAYSPSERLPARPPSNPQLWQPSMSPAEDTVPPRTGSGLARRGSTASIRSTGSGSIRPNIAEPIPEHEGESGEREKEPTEPRRRRESEQSKPPDPPVSTYAPSSTARPDSWTTSESSTLHDELASFSPPKPPSVTRVQDIMGPPATPPTRPPSTRKPSFQAEDRDHYQSQRLRNQTSFDDRAPFPPSSYTPAPPASRPSPRPGADFYEYPRPRDYYPPYSAPLPVDSPYGGEQRSNTWRRATQPESPPTRRPSENPRPTLNRDPSYGTKYARPADDDSPVYDDHRYFEYPPVKYDKYDPHPTSAIPIRQRNPSYNDDINGNGWKSGTWAEPIVRPRTRGPRPDFDDYPARGGYDYDRDRDRDYRPRDDHWGHDREYDRDEPRTGGYDRDRAGYHTSRYSSEMVHSNSRDSYGLARSSPSSYRNENHHRFGGREYRPSWDDEEEDDYLDNPYSREYSDSTRYSRDYHRVRGSNFEREAAEVRTELFKDIRRQHGKPRYLDPPSTGESSLSDDDADDERPRVVSFVREKVPTRQKSLKMARKRSQSQGPSKEELEAAEQRRKEEEEKRRQEEAARREEEIEKKAMELMAEMQRTQEEERRRIEEVRLKEEEELKKAEEEKRKREEIETKRRERDQRKKAEKEAATKRREEERRKKEEDERRRQEEEERERLEEERQRLEDERKREEEEERWRKEEQFRKEREAVRRKEEEIRRKEEEARKKEEEWKRKELEAKRKEEEARKKEQEWKRREQEAREEARRKEEELTRKEQEARRKEEETRKKEEEFKRKEQEAKKKEQEARKKERELKRKEEETKRKELELKRKEEEARRRAEEVEAEARRREEELEVERRRVEEEREEARRKEEEAQRREDELRRREEELQRRESEIAARRQQQQAEFRKREEEIRRRRGDAYDPDAGWAPSSYGSASSFGGRSYKKEDEIRLAAEEARRREKEEEEARKEEEAKQEEARREEETKKKEEEEERLRREQEESDRKAAEKLQEELMAEDREEEERRFKDAQQRDTERRKMDEIWRQKQTEQAKRKQQEEYKRQEEQIRQQAEERKRQRSGTHEFTNGSSSHYPPSSSPPSWTGQSNAWGSSQSSFYSAPRTSTTSANAYSSSFEQKDDGVHDWQRRQEEMFKKQQEQFRKEQERLDSLRQARDAGRPLSKNDILAIYDNHDRLWATMGSKSELRWKDFPWPMFKSPASPEEITMQTVSAYMQSPHYPETMKVKTYKDRLRDHIRRWHPDRFETQTLPRVVEDQKETVREAAGSVVRVLNDLNSRANNVHDVFS